MRRIIVAALLCAGCVVAARLGGDGLLIKGLLKIAPKGYDEAINTNIDFIWMGLYTLAVMLVAPAIRHTVKAPEVTVQAPKVPPAKVMLDISTAPKEDLVILNKLIMQIPNVDPTGVKERVGNLRAAFSAISELSEDYDLEACASKVGAVAAAATSLSHLNGMPFNNDVKLDGLAEQIEAVGDATEDLDVDEFEENVEKLVSINKSIQRLKANGLA